MWGMIERRESSYDPEQARLLKEKLQVWGKNTAIFDLDDTLIATNSIFKTAIQDVCLLLSDQTGLEANKIAAMFPDTIAGLRNEFQVSEHIVDIALILVAKQIGVSIDSETMQHGFSRIRQIYTVDIPPVIPGASDTVRAFNQAIDRTVLITHGEEPNSKRKLWGSGFVGTFQDRICMNVRIPKADQWEEKFAALNIDPNKAIVIGDNFKADIVRPTELGAHGFWLAGQGRLSDVAVSEALLRTLPQTHQDRISKVSTIDTVIPKILAR